MTISPVSWSRNKIAKEFGVTEYIAKMAIQLRSKKGIFAEPAIKKGKPLPQATVEAIKRFYLDDNNSYMRVMPGKKDSVSVAYKKHEQKRLICAIWISYTMLFVRLTLMLKLDFPLLQLSRSLNLCRPL